MYVLIVLTGHLGEFVMAKIFPFEWSSVPSRLRVRFLLESIVSGSSLFSSKYSSPPLVMQIRIIDFFMTLWFSRPRLPKYMDI